VKFLVSRDKSTECLLVECFHKRKVVSSQSVFDDDLLSFIESYLRMMKVEPLSALGITEWWITDSEGMMVEGHFIDVEAAHTRCDEIKREKPNIVWETF
jgi:hypothetical protein